MEWIYDEQGRPEKHKDVLVATLDERDNKIGYQVMCVDKEGEWMTHSFFTEVIAWTEIEGLDFQEGTPDTPRDVLIKIRVDKKRGESEPDNIPEGEQEVGYMVYSIDPRSKGFETYHEVIGWSDFDYLTQNSNGTPLLQRMWNAQKK